MCAYKGRITVEDASGVHLDLHEFRCRRFLRSVSKFKLDTGELVTRIGGDRYVIAATGETLVRKDGPGENADEDSSQETSEASQLK